MLRKSIAVLLLGLSLTSPALAQSTQLGSGQLLGNATAAQRPATATSVTGIVDRALGSTRGSVLERGASGWQIITPGTSGLPFISSGAGADPAYGILGLSGGGCNAALTASNGGILWSTATACAVLPGTATARQMLQSGATATPAWSTTTWPATTTINRLLWSSAANVISDLATANGSLLNTSATGVPSLTPTPVLGVAGTTVGSIGLQNATSGTITVQPVTGALGSSVLSLPAITDTLAGKALANGGTNASLTASNGGILWSNASQMQILAGTATANLPLLSGATATPAWATVSHPTSAVSGGIPFFSSTTVMGTSALLTANQIMIGGGAATAPTTFACATTTTVVHGGTPPTCGSVVYADIAAGALATSANLEAGAASTILSAPIIYDPEVTVTFAASQTLDFNTFLNARITATANTTSLTCSNIKASQSGAITWVQDGTGSRTMVAGWCSQFRWSGGTRGVLSTAAAAIDTLFYQCISSSICYVSLGKAQAN